MNNKFKYYHSLDKKTQSKPDSLSAFLPINYFSPSTADLLETTGQAKWLTS